MRCIATVLLAIDFLLNSMAGVIGEIVVCIHEDIIHIGTPQEHRYAGITLPNYVEFYSDRSSCLDTSDCIDFIVGSKDAYELGLENANVPLPKIFVQNSPNIESDIQPQLRIFHAHRIYPHNTHNNPQMRIGIPLII